MNVGEGTGQLPEDWEESYVGEGSDDSNWNREEGNTEEYSAAWVESENDQEESAQWNLDFRQMRYVLRKKALWKMEYCGRSRDS